MKFVVRDNPSAVPVTVFLIVDKQGSLLKIAYLLRG